MLIDTHCHLDAPQFDVNRASLYQQALDQGLGQCVIPAVERANFTTVQALARSLPGAAYALGIHPMFVPHAQEEDLDVLEQYLQQYHDDPCLVAVGEIGLDAFVPDLREPALLAKQVYFFEYQLRLARRFNLPVIVHGRRAQDLILKSLRKLPVKSGIFHAFNGSDQQAQHCLGLGLKLGVGGAMTYIRARQIRHLVRHLPEDAWVLETDSPDMPPAWLSDASSCNSPCELSKIAHVMAELRQLSISEVMAMTHHNAWQALPKLATLAT